MVYSGIMKPIIKFADFEKIDLRVGQIVSCRVPSWSQKLLELRVDFGPEIGEKIVFAGVQKYFAPDYLTGKKAAFVVNLLERKMGEGVSQGMMLVASDENSHSPLFIEDTVAPGASVR